MIYYLNMTMRIVKLLALLSIALCSASVHAASWQTIGTKNGAKIQIDTSSMAALDAGKHRLWYREYYAKPVVPESGAFSFNFLTVFVEFECSPKRSQTLQRRYAKANGMELKNEPSEETTLKALVPDSIQEMVISHACNTIDKKKADSQAKSKETPPEAEVAAATPPKNETKKQAKSKSRTPAPPAAWGYDKENGPERWGSLSPDYALCSTGQMQSPIDIRQTILADLEPVQFIYQPTPFSITNGENSIEVSLENAGGIIIDNQYYRLQQLHFHLPSEEKINGKNFAMSVHLVHRSETGKVTIIALLVTAGKEQALIRTLWSKLPLAEKSKITVNDLKIDPLELFPDKRAYYTYMGSLTTPPCTEDVQWIVFKTPITLSKEQISAFSSLHANNARPVQPVNGRAVKESR